MQKNTFTDKKKIKSIIDKCDVCYLGMSDKENIPYVLPFNFGYKNDTIFFHSAKTGKKADVLKNNPNVCVAFSTDHNLFHRNKEVACSYGMSYSSVLAYGEIVFLEDFDKKKEALNIIMRKYTGKDFDYNAPAIENVAVFKLEASKMEGHEIKR